MKNLDAMTFDELRDHAATADGWRRLQCSCGMHECSGTYWQQTPSKRSGGGHFHPIPATLDAIAGLMPEGWDVRIVIDQDGCDATGYPAGEPEHDILAQCCEGDRPELHARLLLACKCRESATPPSGGG